MKIAFTICSNNYLSQAKILADSIAKYNPEYKFIIGLCDKEHESVDYSEYQSVEILRVEDIGISNLDWMTRNYNIIELNTASKPYYFNYLISKHKNEGVEYIMYFDPDIKIFSSLISIEQDLANKTCVLTPHTLQPTPMDGLEPDESTFLNFGIYNLGFFALRPCPEVSKLIDWWMKRLKNQCLIKVDNGLFVDQLPMNHVPIFFKDVVISHNPGLNFAYWNMHERKITKKDGIYYANSHPLIFYHFSGFKPNYPLQITKYPVRFKVDDDKNIYELYDNYAQDLLSNKFVELQQIPCYYVLIKNKIEMEKAIKLHKENSKLSARIKRFYRRVLNK